MDISFLEDKVNGIYKLVSGYNRYGGGLWMGLFYESTLSKIEDVESYITGGDNDYARIDNLLFQDCIYPIVYCDNIVDGLKRLNNKVKEYKGDKANYDYLVTTGLQVILDVMKIGYCTEKDDLLFAEKIKELELEEFIALK